MTRTMKKEDNPCYKCTDRKAMCRIGCKRAKEYEEKRKAEKEKIFAARKSDYDMRAYMIEKGEKFRNYKKGRFWGK